VLCIALSAAYASNAAEPKNPASLSLDQLLDITVVGAAKYEQRQSEVAASVSVITRQDIKAFGWRTLGEALASLPGVYTTYDRQYSYLGMRGFGLPGDLDTRTLITINGNRVNDPVFDQGPIGRDFPLDVDLIERIEFIPGPGGAVYGQNAMFGVVNVVTRSGSDVDGGELVGAWQRAAGLGEGRASWGKRFDSGADLLLSVSGMDARGQKLFFDYGASGVSGVATGLDGERNHQFFARATDGPWSFDFVYGDHQKHDPTGAYLSDPLVSGQYQGDCRSVSQLEYHDLFLGDTLQLFGRLFLGSERYTSYLYYGGVPFASPATGEWRGTELRLLSTAVAGHKLMLGVEYQDNVRQDQYIVHPDSPAHNIGIPESGFRSGLYAEDEFRIADAWSAILGVRLDHDNVTGSKSSPRAALIWQVTPAATVKAMYGTANRSPNAFERNYGDGVTQTANLSLSGETIGTAELVADYRVSADVALRASLYQWVLHNLITLGIDPVGGLSQYQSDLPERARGIELSADKTWSSGTRLRSSLSLQNVTRDYVTGQVNSPPVLGKLNLSTPLPMAGVQAGYELGYDGKRLTLNGTELGGYVVSNLNLSTATLAKGLDASITIYNVFDKNYAQPGAATNWQSAIAQDRRTVQVKLVYAF
jgi:iron complex outermembrane receptor protein